MPVPVGARVVSGCGTGFGAVLWTMLTMRQINFSEFFSEENEAVYFGTKLVDSERKL